jgi:hypothetical protein
MHKNTLMTCLLAAGCLTLASTSASAQDANSRDQRHVFDLSFRGGTVGEYAEAIRKVDSSVNIVVMPNAAIVPVPALTLQSVSVHGALDFLDGREYQIGREAIQLDLSFYMDGPPSSREEIFTIGARGAVEPTQSLVMSVAPLLDAMSKQDLLTAIEVALEMVSENRAPAAVKYHEATNILLVRGHPEQIGIVHDMLSELFSAANRKRAEQEEQAKVNAMGAELRALRSQNEQLQVALNQSHLKLSEWDTRYSMLNDQRQSLQQRLAETDMERRQHLDLIATLEAKVSQLQDEKNIYTDKN